MNKTLIVNQVDEDTSVISATLKKMAGRCEIVKAESVSEGFYWAKVQSPDLIVFFWRKSRSEDTRWLLEYKWLVQQIDAVLLVLIPDKCPFKAYDFLESMEFDVLSFPVNTLDMASRIKSSIRFREVSRLLLQNEMKIEKMHKEIKQEKKRVNTLLENIFPKAIIDELRTKGQVKARTFDFATVMFTDFVGFTKYSSTVPPAKLIKILNIYFAFFDEIISKYSIEKIKTIGDSYMCVSGLPVSNARSPYFMVLAALEIQSILSGTRRWNGIELPGWNLRIGIHTGTVIAGIIGTKKYAFDIWGDTVNMASRMESSCDAGRINISSETYSIVRDFFECTYRGRIPAKNLGLEDMYFVDRVKPTFSGNANGTIPNELMLETIKYVV